MNNKLITSESLIKEAYIADDDRYWDIIHEVRSRGSIEEYKLAKSLAASERSLERRVAADILGQIGWKDNSFYTESVELLESLLEDESDEVIASAGYSLGHRKAKSSIDKLLILRNHSNSEVRGGVVSGLIGHEDLRAINALIILSRDVDRDVRNWATFGVGSMCDADTAELRDALVERLSEKDDEIRGEALIGLARRKDTRVENALMKELKGEFMGNWALEAVSHLGDEKYYETLKDLYRRECGQVEERFVKDFEEAISKCCPK